MNRYKPGDKVCADRWRVGRRIGVANSQRRRSRPTGWCPYPRGLDNAQADGCRNSGLYRDCCRSWRWRITGWYPGNGPVLVSRCRRRCRVGCSRDSCHLGYEVFAGVTRAPGTAINLKSLASATNRCARRAEHEPSSARFEAETWAGCIDRVGGEDAGAGIGPDEIRRLGRCLFWSSRAGQGCCHCPSLVCWRGVNLLAIDFRHAALREPSACMAAGLGKTCRFLQAGKNMVVPQRFSDLPKPGRDILNGQVRAVWVVDVKRLENGIPLRLNFTERGPCGVPFGVNRDCYVLTLRGRG